MRLFIAILLSLSLWVVPKGLEAMNHKANQIPANL
jgi:hypothetical protein